MMVPEMKDRRVITSVAFIIVTTALIVIFFFTRDLIWVVFALLMVVGWLLDPEAPKPSFLDRWNEWLIKNRPGRLNMSDMDEITESDGELSVTE